ncbi:MAG TPA: protein kinase [Polyangiaceae bacterium]|jgi:CheY-like chemotaxis protein
MKPAFAQSDRGCVLVVDDEATLRRGLARQLRARGHAVVQAATGVEALEAVESASPDVVVCDIAMPEMDGVSLLRALHERDPELPVILLTGSPEMSTAIKAVSHGAFDYLTKPDALPQLPVTVERAIAKRRMSNTQKRLANAAAASERRIRADAHVESGDVIAGRYKIGRSIGVGGMGEVFEAFREDLGGMRVAVKVLQPHGGNRAIHVRRFRREAEIIAALNHPNIVRLVDFVSVGESGPHCLVMELLEGVTLATAIANDPPFSPERLGFVARQVLAALAVAHGAGVVHRDLKPENVFLTNVSGVADIAKLLDFGIAKIVTPSKLTDTGVMLGTPAYMAPEYARGAVSDARADIYALGCVMYEALTGAPPFTAANYNALLYAIQRAEPTPLAKKRSDVPAELAAIVARAMAKRPDARFSSADEMAAALEPWSSWAPSRASERGIALAPTEALDVKVRDVVVKG